MRVLFVDPHEEFFHFVGEKFGADFHLEPLTDFEDDSSLSADVIVLGFPGDPQERATAVGRLQDLASTPGAPPVIVFSGRPAR